jgi:excisionase family DNA binding protein
MPDNRLTVVEIAKRLGLGKVAIYGMLEQGVIPAIRVGRNWLITRQAYEEWERTCGQGRRQLDIVRDHM